MGSLKLERLTMRIGAEVSGLDLRELEDSETIAEIRRALVDYQLLVFRGQGLNEEQHVAFARRFGQVQPTAVPTKHTGPPEINVLDMGTAPKGNGADRWHCDSLFLEVPTMATVLNAKVIPPAGGDTCFANMYDAYDNLSEPMKRYVEGLRAVNDVSRTLYGAADQDHVTFDVEEMRRRLPPVEHPVVRTHPETGRKVLFVDAASTSHIVGVPRHESDAILELLYRQSHNPNVQCRVRWQAGDLVFYDNRSTQHYAVSDYTERRVMHLVSLTGTRPV